MSLFGVLTEKLSQAKEENIDMHQMLDQTLMELNNLWSYSLTLHTFIVFFLHLAYYKTLFVPLTIWEEKDNLIKYSKMHGPAFSETQLVS